MRQLKITKSITNRESASLDKYLQEIGREELVSPEEEVELAQRKEAENGVLIVSAGNGKVARAGGEDGFLIRFVNDQKVSKPQDVIDIAKKSKRSIFIEGYDANGRPAYFGFGKDE